MSLAGAITAFQERFPELELAPRPLLCDEDGRESDQLWLRIPAERLLEVARFARDDRRTGFEQLADLTAIDYLNYPDAEDRYAVVYSLLSVTHNQRLWLKVFVNDPDPEVPSVTSIWRGADWPEREVLDLYGISFAGHPDPRRLFLSEDFGAHPLRKDYPLRGVGERSNFDVVDRETV